MKNVYAVREVNTALFKDSVSKAFDSKKAAQKYLTERYHDILHSVSKTDIESRSHTASAYIVLTVDHFYYGYVFAQHSR